MTVKSSLYNWLECDTCNRRSTDGSEHSAWEEVQHAEEEASESGWLIRAHAHYCPDHWRWCEECGVEQMLPGEICVECGWGYKT